MPRPGPRTAVAVFVTHGLLVASWTAHIPHVKAQLGLTDATLGLALLGAPAGSVLSMLASAWLLPRVGSRRMVRVSLVGYCLAGALVGVAGAPAALFGALAAWGAFQGMLDVSMNTQAIAVETALRRPVMSGLHGGWSLGSLAGAGIGAACVAAGISLSPQLLVLGLAALAVTGVPTGRLVADPPPRERPVGLEASRGRRDPAILVLGAIAFAGMLCEGAAADWSAVYLRDTVHTSAGVAGLGYAAFAVAMVTVRLLGNQLLSRVATTRLLPALAAIATVGFAAGLLVGGAAAVLLGFGCLGLGLAAVIPAVFGAAGRLPGVSTGVGVAAVSGCGWAGFVCGPPLIGQLAGAASLTVALGVLPVLTAAIAVVMASPRALGADARPLTGTGAAA